MAEKRRSNPATAAEKKRVRDRRAQQNLRDRRTRHVAALEEQAEFCKTNHSQQDARLQEAQIMCDKLQSENSRLRKWLQDLKNMLNVLDLESSDSLGASVPETIVCEPIVDPPPVQESFSSRSSPQAQEERLITPEPSDQSWEPSNPAVVEFINDQVMMDPIDWFSAALECNASVAPLESQHPGLGAFDESHDTEADNHGVQAQIDLMHAAEPDLILDPLMTHPLPTVEVHDIDHHSSRSSSASSTSTSSSTHQTSRWSRRASAALDGFMWPFDFIPRQLGYPRWALTPRNDTNIDEEVIKYTPWAYQYDMIMQAPDEVNPLDLLFGSKTNQLASSIHSVLQVRTFRDAERLAIGWLLYYFTKWRVQPTSERYDRLPEYMKPVAEQLLLPHASYLDNLLWDRLRVNIIWNRARYELDSVFKLFARCLRVRWPSSENVVEPCDNGQLRVRVDFFDRFMSVDGWGVSREFIKVFPELLEGLDFDSIQVDDVTVEGLDAI